MASPSHHQSPATVSDGTISVRGVPPKGFVPRTTSNLALLPPMWFLYWCLHSNDGALNRLHVAFMLYYNVRMLKRSFVPTQSTMGATLKSARSHNCVLLLFDVYSCSRFAEPKFVDLRSRCLLHYNNTSFDTQEEWGRGACEDCFHSLHPTHTFPTLADQQCLWLWSTRGW